MSVAKPCDISHYVRSTCDYIEFVVGDYVVFSNTFWERLTKYPPLSDFSYVIAHRFIGFWL